LLPTLRQQLPGGMALELAYDRSQTVRSSVNDVKFTLLLSLGSCVGDLPVLAQCGARR